MSLQCTKCKMRITYACLNTCRYGLSFCIENETAAAMKAVGTLLRVQFNLSQFVNTSLSVAMAECRLSAQTIWSLSSSVLGREDSIGAIDLLYTSLKTELFDI